MVLTFDMQARTLFLDWLVSEVLPAAPRSSALDSLITQWFLSQRMIRFEGNRLWGRLRLSAKYPFKIVYY